MTEERDIERTQQSRGRLVAGPIVFTCSNPNCEHTFEVPSVPRTSTLVVCPKCKVATPLHDRRGVTPSHSQRPQVSPPVVQGHSWIQRLMPDRRLLGSTLAILFGVLYYLSASASLQSGGSVAGIIGGSVMVLGGVAYRSRKRRLLRLVPTNLARKVLEALLLVSIPLVVGLQLDLKIVIATDPVPNLIVPLCAIIAYFCAGIRTKPE